MRAPLAAGRAPPRHAPPPPAPRGPPRAPRHAGAAELAAAAVSHPQRGHLALLRLALRHQEWSCGAHRGAAGVWEEPGVHRHAQPAPDGRPPVQRHQPAASSTTPAAVVGAGRGGSGCCPRRWRGRCLRGGGRR